MIKINDSIALNTLITICIATTNAVIANTHPITDINTDPNDLVVFIIIYFEWLEVSVIFHTEV